MKSKIIAVGGLLLALVGSTFAGVLGGPSGRPEIKAPVVTAEEALQSTIDFSKMVAERPGFLGEKVVLAQARLAQAKQDLANVEAIRTAGPTKTVDTAYYKFVSERPGFLGEKIVLIQARKAEADKVLAGQ